MPHTFAFKADDLLVEEYIKDSDTLGLASVGDINASKRLDRYLESIVNDSTIALRLVNDTDYRMIHWIKYLWHNDTLETMPWDTMYLISMCWVLQQQPDSLRYVFIRNINNLSDTTIVDTTVVAKQALQHMELWGVIDSTTAVNRGWHYVNFTGRLPSGIREIVFGKFLAINTGYTRTIADYWSMRRKFRLRFSSLYHPYSCGKKVITDQKNEDVLLYLHMLDLLCQAQEIGAFQNAFTVPLWFLNEKTQTYEQVK